jgi:hypothetical protein
MFKAISIVVIGIGLLVAAAISAHSTREFIRTSIVVPGHVVKLNAGGYHPQIEFVTREGEHVTYPQSLFISRMKVGDQCEVRYLPDNPIPTATLNRLDGVWSAVIFLAVMGCGFIVCGLMNLPSRK